MISFKNPDGTLSKTFDSELVYNDQTRSLGLMYRKEMSETEAMFFIFPIEKPLEFWMKNTYLPLDIIFLDKDLKVINIAKNALPLSTTAIPSEGLGQYVLEIKAGLSDKNLIAKGSKALIKGNLPQAK